MAYTQASKNALQTLQPEEAPGQPILEEKKESKTSQAIFVILLGALYICVSACLITFNKYLIHEGRFPFAVPLVSVHMLCSSSFAGLLFLIVPSFFKSLSDPEKRTPIDGELYLKRLLPIAVTFSASMVLSNQAYLYLSVAFLQMMKETNVVLVYVFSLVAMLETFTGNQLKLIALIVLASVLTIEGELNFSIVGFAIQGCGQLCECTKVVLQGLLLSNAGMKLDAPSFVLLVSPVCLVCLLTFISIFHTVAPDGAMKVPQWEDIQTWWPFLLVNGALAFLLNIIVALFIKNTSAVALILAGIVKDAAIVFAGVFVLDEHITSQQALGFLLQLLFIGMWSSMKMCPEEFEDGILNGLAGVMSKALKHMSRSKRKDDTLQATYDYGSSK